MLTGYVHLLLVMYKSVRSFQGPSSSVRPLGSPIFEIYLIAGWFFVRTLLKLLERQREEEPNAHH